MNLYINQNNTHTEILQSLKEKVQAENELGETEMSLIFVKTTVHFLCMHAGQLHKSAGSFE